VEYAKSKLAVIDRWANEKVGSKGRPRRLFEGRLSK
jgi:hypothetical protein